MSSNYVQGHSDAIIRGHASRTATSSCKHFLHLIKPTDHILDVGCGPGSITASLALRVPDGKIIGLDSSETVLEKARKQQDLLDHCTFQTGDAYALPFPDSSFDIVHTSQVIGHMKDPVAAIVELRRVCKVGGFVACREGDTDSIIVHPTSPGLDHFKRVMCAAIETNGPGPQAGRLLLGWALDAGFSHEKVEYSGDTMTYAVKERAWWAQVNQGRINDPTWRGNLLKAGTIEEDLKLMYEAWQTWAEDPAGLFTIFCGQVVCHK